MTAEISDKKIGPIDTLKRPLRDLRISVIDRCNFRCPYCMPAELFGESYSFMPRAELLSFEEITRLARIFVKLGVTKVRLTGGEPLLRAKLEILVAMLSKIDGIDDLTLTTNAFLLAEKAEALKLAGLQRVTVSLDSLDDGIFKEMSGSSHNIQHVLDGIRIAGKVGLTPLKINTVVQKNINDHKIMDLARYFRGTGHILRFIEFMDVGSLNNWNMDNVVPSRELIDRINDEFPLELLPPNYLGEVASRYKYKDGGGEIGFISSVTLPFCGDCERVRISADGKLVTCLFASEGFDLKRQMRNGMTDLELENMVAGVWTGRTDRYSELRSILTGHQSKKIEMYQIGG